MPNYYEYTNEEWEKLIRNIELTEEFLTCYAPCFDEWLWAYVSNYQNLSFPFIYRFQHSLNIKTVIQTQRVHQNNIYKHWDLLSEYQWDLLKHQYISEEFIVEFHDHLDIQLKYVLELQPHLSLEFIKEFFPIAYHGEYVPRKNQRKPIPIHEKLQNRYISEINDMIKNHNKHLEEMSKIHVSSPKKKTFSSKDTLK